MRDPAILKATFTGGEHLAAQQRSVVITLAVLCGIVGYVAWRIAAPYAAALLMGFALSAAFYPLYMSLRQRTGGSPWAAFLTTVIVVVAVLVPLVFVTITIVRELQHGIQALAANGGWSEGSRLKEWVDDIAGRFGSNATEVEANVRERMEQGANALLRGIFAAAGAATGGILQSIVTIGAIHFGFSYGHTSCQRILNYSPLGRKRTRILLNTTYEMVRTSFYGIVAVAAAQGLLMGIAAWIAGLPAPVLWGFITAVVSVLPLIGSALVWVPGTIMLLASGKTGMAIFVAIWGAALVSNIDNLVRPLIVMAALPVSGLLVFIAILGGIQAFGVIGIFIGPVTLAIGMALLEMVREEVQARGEEV